MNQVVGHIDFHVHDVAFEWNHVDDWRIVIVIQHEHIVENSDVHSSVNRVECMSADIEVNRLKGDRRIDGSKRFDHQLGDFSI